MKILLNNDIFLSYENAKKALEFCYVKKGVAGFKYPFFSPGGYGECWWEIDSSYAAEAYSYIDFITAKNAMLNFFFVQKEDGRIPLWGNDILPKSENHPLQSDNASALPVLFMTGFAVAKRSRDNDFRHKIFNMLYKYLNWWKKERKDKNTGLITYLFEETFPPYLGRAGEYCGVDTNVAVAIGAKICG